MELDATDQPPDPDIVRAILKNTYDKIRENYIEKHDTVLQLRTQIEEQLKDDIHWWNRPLTKGPETDNAVRDFTAFLDNIELNFIEESFAYQQITSAKNAQPHLTRLFDAILQYNDDTKNWEKALRS